MKNLRHALPKSMIEMTRPLRPGEKKIQESLANEWKTQNYKYFKRSCLVLSHGSGKYFMGQTLLK
jgi:hypothetical protein